MKTSASVRPNFTMEASLGSDAALIRGGRSLPPGVALRSPLGGSGPHFDWIDGRRLHCLAGPAILFARVTGEWSVRSPEGRATGRAADLASAMREAEEGQPTGRGKWRRYVTAELPGDVCLGVGRGLSPRCWWWTFHWSEMTPFSGIESSLSAAMAVAESHVRAEIMVPMLRLHARFQIALNPSAIPFHQPACLHPLRTLSPMGVRA